MLTAKDKRAIDAYLHPAPKHPRPLLPPHLVGAMEARQVEEARRRREASGGPMMIQELRAQGLTYKTAEIVADIDAALERSEPYVLNRMGDGEAAWLMWARGRSVTTPSLAWSFEHYRIDPDNRKAVRKIVDGMVVCNALGVPWLEKWANMWNMLPLCVDAFAAWSCHLEAMPLTHQFVVRYMCLRGEFERWHGRRLIVVNEDAEEVAEALGATMNIVGAVAVGWNEIDEVVERCAKYDFEIALLGVGVRKFAIAHRLAELTGRVVLDVGHTLNQWADVNPANYAEEGNYQRLFMRDWAEAERIVKEAPEDV
jgi:hypothetical protein